MALNRLLHWSNGDITFPLFLSSLLVCSGNWLVMIDSAMLHRGSSPRINHAHVISGMIRSGAELSPPPPPFTTRINLPRN